MQVTWSKDHTLRLWQIDPTIQNQCSREASGSEDTSMSGGNEEDSPVESPVKQKPSDLPLGSAGSDKDWNKVKQIWMKKLIWIF